MNKISEYLKDLLNIIIYFIIVAAAIFLVNKFVVQQIQVCGTSMVNTLHDKDRLIIEKLSFRFGSPGRFDIIVFRPYENERDTYYIKRIIGLPGETVRIKNGSVFVNGKRLEEPYGFERIINSGVAEETISLNKDEYFVLGDNRNNSKDSRNAEVGNIKRKNILGKSFVRIWPMNRAGLIRN